MDSALSIFTKVLKVEDNVKEFSLRHLEPVTVDHSGLIQSNTMLRGQKKWDPRGKKGGATLYFTKVSCCNLEHYVQKIIKTPQ